MDAPFEEAEQVEGVVEGLDVLLQPLPGESHHELEDSVDLLLLVDGLYEELASEGLGVLHVEVHVELEVVVTDRLLYPVEELEELLLDKGG